MDKTSVRVRDSNYVAGAFSFYLIGDPNSAPMRNWPKFVLKYEDVPMMIRGRLMMLKLTNEYTFVDQVGLNTGRPNNEMILMLFDNEHDELCKVGLEKNCRGF
jgi:hypothetical protein